jgi:hypothetical protein
MLKIARNAALGFMVVGMGLPAWATYSRVESMGKRADFFMDDISIFDNPANMNIFPNFLIGELGTYRALPGDSAGVSSQTRRNMDPANSWFGGIFSYSLSKNKESGNLYPQISLGGAFNRTDEELALLIPDSVDGNPVPDPATNFDGFLGMTLSNGGMLGSHIYVAVQEGADLRNGVLGAQGGDINLYMMRGDLGLNWPIARNIDGELSLGLSSIYYGPVDIDPEMSWWVKGRAFSTLEIINGELVPIFNYSSFQAPGKMLSKLHFGLGVNVSLDRGFFWLGVQGLFDELEETGFSTDPATGAESYNSTVASKSTESIRGGLISFGIERNVWWDWLVLRVGGQKEITYRSHDGAGGSFNYIHTNPTNDGTADDHVGFGIGINVEEKLKVDATLAEDILYTFGNLLSGPSHHVISRISATYSF